MVLPETGWEVGLLAEGSSVGEPLAGGSLAGGSLAGEQAEGEQAEGELPAEVDWAVTSGARLVVATGRGSEVAWRGMVTVEGM